MSEWSFFDPATGLFDGRRFSGPDRMLHANQPPGMAALKGAYDHLSQRVDLATGKVVDYKPPAPPDTEFETFAWDASIKRWVGTPTAAAHWRRVRAERDRRLAACDWIVARSAERGEPIPQAWKGYRQALRDITMQPDPLFIQWPEAPK